MNKIGVCILLPMLAGCYWTGEKIIPFTPAPTVTEPAGTVRQDQASLEQRFSDSEKIEASQLATLWSQRYEELSKQCEQVRKDYAALTEQHNLLQQDAAKTKMELEQTRKDLERSNALLQEAHVELSKWKSDVLGFREEIRQAQTAQLLALSKILRILGAEPIVPPTEAQQPAAKSEGGS